MKNPLKWLKHIVKDPITTIDEANARKKEIMPGLYVCLGLIVLGVLFQVVLKLDFMSFLTMIGGVGAVFFGFLLFVIKKAKQRFEALTCECGEMFKLEDKADFSKYISFAVVSENVTTKLQHPESKDGVVPHVTASVKADATVEITVKCPKCGKERTLVYKITPFKAEKKETKVGVLVLPALKVEMEKLIAAVAEDYKAGKGDEIPFSIHSIHNPKNAEKTKAHATVDDTAFPVYKGVKVMYHRTVAEMVEGFFCENELNGSISVKK